MTTDRMKMLDQRFGQVGERQKLGAALVSFGINGLLIAIKVVVALATGSLAILAEVGHSATDLTASAFAYWGIRQSIEPPDAEHQYGHEKFENLSSLIQTALLMGICLAIFYEAGRRLLAGFSIEVTAAAFGVMLLAIVVDFLLARYLYRVAERYQSSALQADAYHFTSDLWGSLAVLVGLGAASLGYPVMDPLAAAVVALVMLTAAYRLARRSTAVLLDTSPGRDAEEEVRHVLDSMPEVLAFHDLRLRLAGSRVWLDVSIHLDPELSLRRAHAISDQLSQRLHDALPRLRDAVIHVEPADEHPALPEVHGLGKVTDHSAEGGEQWRPS
ncbi:MAG: cation transporter [Chloroflexi bacterium]|nr:cation transporter [Chloroflexota bacterium]